LRWSFLTLNGEDPRIDLPAEITKAGEPRSLPLGPLSISLLDAQPRAAGTDLVFPGRGEVEMAGWSRRLAPVKRALGAPGFGLHALRRSYRSGLSDLEVPEEIAERMIGHKRPGLMGTYDHSTVWSARVEAQAQWEGLLAEF
jgi:integrase